MIEVAIGGAAGRMGRMLTLAIASAPDLYLAAALEAPGAEHCGRDAGELAGTGTTNVVIGSDIAAVLDSFEVLVDFSVPAGALAKIDACAEAGKALVIGTTGFDSQGLAAIERAAKKVPVLLSPNMSVGVNITFKLIEAAAKAFGEEVDVEVFEAHHRHKIDAPSGTAVRMGEILANVLGRNLAEDAVYGREGETGARERRSIGFHSLRGGDIVGDHTVTFAGTGERVEITHRAGSRENFAAGALRAVRYVAGRQAGLYGMEDVLGL